MKDLKKTSIFFIILGFVYIAASVDTDDDLVQVEDEESYYEIKDQNQDASFQKLKRWFSFPQSPILDMMKQSMAINAPLSTDIFACLRDTYPLPKGFSRPLDEYDYVIVGAGSGGSTLASRLTEGDSGATVLLLEAGHPEMLLGDIPMFVPFLQLSDYSWQYSIEHQPGICMGSENGRCFWPRGKAVGGSSATNFMMYTRGRPQDWDRIAADGNYGWSYYEILPYYIKSQKSEVKKYKYEPYSGRDGPLYVSNAAYKTELVDAFLEAGRIYGNPTLDYNAPNGFGFGYIQATIHRGHRWSAATGYLHSHKRRWNLHILPESRVTKILIKPQTKRAYAVEYIRNNTKHIVRCRKEIILSAGPIASPQLLMLSGIGPKKHLQQHGIPVISDLQVGRTLYDHLGFPGVIFRLNRTDISLTGAKLATLQNLIQWVHYGDSLFASPGTVEAIGYIKTEVSRDPEPVPDIEFISLAGSIALDGGFILRRLWKISDEEYYPAFGSLTGYDTWSAIPLLLHPRSKGYLELRDTNPFSFPKIVANYFKEPEDMATMIAAVRYVIKLGESEPFKKFGAVLHRAQHPGCEGYKFNSDGYWDCAIRTLVITIFHPMSTCRMGPPDDPEAVVDPELRVYGVKGLRVVDSSIIPRTISAHTNAPAIMIAEKAADLIKKTWAKPAHYTARWW